ncbi:MAG: Dps family protein [Clostridia bacterium]
MEEIANNLNNFLADLAVFYRKLQNYHWNIEGKDFLVIHAKLEEYYDDINKMIDEIGEYILTIGKQPLATLKDYLQIAKIQEADNKKVKCEEVFENVIKDFTYLLQQAKTIKENADKIGDYATSTMMDEPIADFSKKLWMLHQTMA